MREWRAVGQKTAGPFFWILSSLLHFALPGAYPPTAAYLSLAPKIQALVISAIFLYTPFGFIFAYLLASSWQNLFAGGSH
jgi:hypothetical protein